MANAKKHLSKVGLRVHDDGDRQKGLQDMIKNGPGSNGLGPFTLGSGGDGGRCSC